MAIPQTLYFNVSDVSHAGFLYVVGKLLELGATAEEVSVADVQFIDLGGVEDHVGKFISKY